jgi:cytoskeletal protein CcmA (bactofilin family)
MFKPKSNSKSKIETLLSATTRIDGDVAFEGGFHLDGIINGNVKCLTGASTLSVSATGCIEGSVEVTNIILNGLVKGDIFAGDKVELGPEARVLGNVHYLTIETSVGAQINGKLVHRGRPAEGRAAEGCPAVAAQEPEEPPREPVSGATEAQ